MTRVTFLFLAVCQTLPISDFFNDHSTDDILSFFVKSLNIRWWQPFTVNLYRNIHTYILRTEHKVPYVQNIQNSRYFPLAHIYIFIQNIPDLFPSFIGMKCSISSCWKKLLRRVVCFVRIWFGQKVSMLFGNVVSSTVTIICHVVLQCL